MSDDASGMAHDREAWRELIDLRVLAGWMDARELGDGADIDAPRTLGGGTQNILLQFERAGRSYILRRPPRRPRPESDEVMRREITVLAALAGSDVPHPRLIAGEGDPGVLGTAFYLMEPIGGFNPTQGLPPLHAENPTLRLRMGNAMVDAIANLSRIDPDAVGLSNLGKLDHWVERQTSRWRLQLDGYAKFEGWNGYALLPDIDAICTWLEANRPAAMQVGLIHGDYHFANVMFRPDSPELAAIVDWELATRGDPLLDLGWLTATWPDPVGGGSPVSVEPWSGFPPINAVVSRYLDATSRTEDDARWYTVLAPFKLGVLLEGTYARACAKLAPKSIGDQLHAYAISMFERALQRIGQPII